jgi:hypothetical protein
VRGWRATIIIMMLLMWCAAAYAQEEPAAAREQPDSAQEKASAAKDHGRLPICTEGWQFFVAPYLWFPGAHLSLSQQGRFSGTTVADMPWYELGPCCSVRPWGAWAG